MDQFKAIERISGASFEIADSGGATPTKDLDGLRALVENTRLQGILTSNETIFARTANHPSLP